MFPFDAELVPTMLAAYAQGAFPMADPARPAGRTRSGGRPEAAAPRPRRIQWYVPDPRAILPLEPGAMRVPRSLAKRARSGKFELTSDRAFEPVIRACAEPGPGREESWIDEQIVAAYTELHRAGHAHSIEAWRSAGEEGAELVGGIYGVHIGGAFFAESMFCRPALGGTDASKVCLVTLVEHLRARGFVLLDVQIANPHTERFGVVEIPAREYDRRLRKAVGLQRSWSPFCAGAAASARDEMEKPL